MLFSVTDKQFVIAGWWWYTPCLKNNNNNYKQKQTNKKNPHDLEISSSLYHCVCLHPIGAGTTLTLLSVSSNSSGVLQILSVGGSLLFEFAICSLSSICFYPFWVCMLLVSKSHALVQLSYLMEDIASFPLTSLFCSIRKDYLAQHSLMWKLSRNIEVPRLQKGCSFILDMAPAGLWCTAWASMENNTQNKEAGQACNLVVNSTSYCVRHILTLFLILYFWLETSALIHFIPPNTQFLQV